VKREKGPAATAGQRSMFFTEGKKEGLGLNWREDSRFLPKLSVASRGVNLKKNALLFTEDGSNVTKKARSDLIGCPFGMGSGRLRVETRLGWRLVSKTFIWKKSS